LFVFGHILLLLFGKVRWPFVGCVVVLKTVIVFVIVILIERQPKSEPSGNANANATAPGY